MFHNKKITIMKKIITFFATALFTLCGSAQTTISLAGLTAEDVQLDDATLWAWGTQSNKPALSYTGDNTASHTITIKGVEFAFKRNASENFYRLQDAGFYINGTKVEIAISGLSEGQEVIINARSSKSDESQTTNIEVLYETATADAANSAAGTEFKDFKFTALKERVRLRNLDQGIIIASITIGAAPGGNPQPSGDVTEVSTTTLWTLTDAVDGDVLTADTVHNYNGLFLRSNNGAGNHAVKAVAEQAEGIFSNGTAWNTQLTFSCPGAGISENGVTGKGANSKPASGNDRCVAFTPAVDGTLYVAIRTTSFKSDRELYVWSSEGEKVASKPLTDNDVFTAVFDSLSVEGDSVFTNTYHFVELNAAVKAGVSYFIGGSNQNHIAAVLFEVNGEVNAIESPKTFIRKDAIYTLSGQRIAAGYRGLVIKNNRKVMLK